ncbi:MAG: alpha-galactosidase [Anaerolineales bacterium]|nr:alpha-galactosidase [Anaerolineales bacterium]
MPSTTCRTQDHQLFLESPSLTLQYNLLNGCLSLSPAGRTYPRLDGARVGLRAALAGQPPVFIQELDPPQAVEQHAFQDIHGSGLELCVRGGAKGFPLAPGLTFRLYEQQPFLLLRLAVQNLGAQPLHIHEFSLLQAGHDNHGQVRFGAQAQMLSFFKVGWHDWVYSGLRHGDQKDITTRLGLIAGKMVFNPALPIGRRRGEFWGEGWGLLTDQKAALLAGFVSTADQFGVLHADCSPRRNAFSLIAQADGIALQPGAELASEWGYLQFIDLPAFDPAADFTQAVARQMQPRLPAAPPSAKWNHWYHFFENISEDLFLANLEAIDRLQDTLPFRTVQLDDGYQSAWGDWDTCNAKFPHGLAYLAEQVRRKGYTPGLWLAPFVVDPRSRLAQQHPDWLVRDNRGKPMRSGFFTHNWGCALDASHPAVLDHLRALMDKIVHQWGFGFVKTDFVYAGALPGLRCNPNLTRAQVFRQGMQAIRQGLGDETFLLGCGCPFGPAIGIVDAMRVGPDTAPAWFPHLWNIPWAGRLIRSERSVASLRNNVRHTLGLSALHRRWWWSDPDCLMARDQDTRLSEAEVISSLSLVGLSGGLLINSDDLTRLSPQRQQLVSLLTPILSPGGQPLDWLEREMPEIYDLPMRQPWGDWQVVAIFNWQDQPAAPRLPVERLGFKPDEDLHVFDFWQRTYHQHQGATISLGEIPPHGCRLLRLCRLDGRPRLVGSTLHITQGGEIRACQAGEDAFEIDFADLERKVEGEIWLALPWASARARLNTEPVSLSAGLGATGAALHLYKISLGFQGAARLVILPG